MKIAIKIVNESIITSPSSSKAPSKLAPRIMGIDNKKEKFAASLGAIPRYIDIDIVVPDLDMPGIIASAWTSPIAKDEKKEWFL